MRFELPALPYDRHSLEPHLSAAMVDAHYSGYHLACIQRLNTRLECLNPTADSLEELLDSTDDEIAYLAAEVWNHAFYWHCLTPWGNTTPAAELKADIDGAFGSLAGFHQAFKTSALAHIGSGWIWLIRNHDGQLTIITTNDGQAPLAQGIKPLIGIDLWEHAWYLDFQNNRDAYLDAISTLINWDFVTLNNG
ncbi:superoxide dismutase [Halomonas huangheensis]|uniref:Superoxide dismutase n=1 Tax=Halomonas huangheensis TaxID=1178482 RepID=W1NBM2_9GAMM|nr:superoxide dismutase [Halomonas huangheensis]ALM52617.1 hypothetical protein AR456_10255 [Halomonas huangheensis]ERL52868.1 hypothetical protein BJB45_16445 [Halomonas huangheensis]